LQGKRLVYSGRISTERIRQQVFGRHLNEITILRREGRKMKADTIPHVIANAFKVPSHATQIEALVGAAILKAERKEGHVGKVPPSPKAHFGAAVTDPVKWRIKVLELVVALEGKPPLSSKQLGALLGCARETAVKRANEAIKQGVVCRTPGKGHSNNNPIFVYAIEKGCNT
jgi:hypothetical protein